MGINSDIKKSIYWNNLKTNNNNFDCNLKDKVEKYLTKKSNSTAKDLFDYLGNHYEKGPLFQKLLDKLKKYEKLFSNLLSKHRLHYKHSADVFSLGLALYSHPKLKNLRECLENFPDEYLMPEQKVNKFIFRWSIASCLHDIAYPIEMATDSFKDSINEYFKWNKPTSLLRLNFDDMYLLNLIPVLPLNAPLEDKYTKDTALKIIASRLTDSMGYIKIPLVITNETMHEIISKHIKNCFEKGIVDHGLFGAIIVLQELYELYKEGGWDGKNFYYHVAESATAIFLHNTYEYLFLENFYGYDKFKPGYPSALGYLLTLCDHLAEWNKFSQNSKIFNKLLKQKNFSLIIDNNYIRLEVPHYKYSKNENEKDDYHYGTYVNKLNNKINKIFDLRELKIEISDKNS